MTTFLGTKLAKIHFTSRFSEYYCIFARIKNKESHRTMEKAKQYANDYPANTIDYEMCEAEEVAVIQTLLL